MQYNKKTFEQWWDSQLNNDYQSLCETISKRREDEPGFPILGFLNVFKEDRKFRPIKKYMKLLAVYEKFGDVHHDDFEEWWGKYTQPKSVKTVMELYDYKEERNTRIDEALQTDDKQLKSYIEIWEQIIYFPNLYKQIEPYVNLNRPLDDIISDMRNFIKQLRQDANKNIREAINERNEYLEVLRLFSQGYSMPQIIKKIGSPEERRFVKKIFNNKVTQAPDVDTLTSYRRKKRKAKEILEHVEQGIFP